MALPPPHAARKPLHRRAIQVEAFERDDGLFDLEARLTDTKPHEIELLAGLLAPGQPIHDMLLRVTVDARFEIVDVQTDSMSVPVPGVCDAIGPAYRRLIGLNLLAGFRREAKARLGGTRGCTHLTELTGVLPTAALQAFGHLVLPVSGSGDASQPPFFIGQCHAYDRSGPVVQRHYPQWFVKAN
jgi:hypothetical protein